MEGLRGERKREREETAWTRKDKEKEVGRSDDIKMEERKAPKKMGRK